MRARILVVKVDDGEVYETAYAIADEYTMDNNSDWLQVEQVQKIREDFGKALLSHGFVDIEIPDSAIEAVTRQHVDAGVVEAKGVESS